MKPASGRKRGRPPNPDLPEQRRLQILDVAAGIFAERGYQKTEMQEVAQTVGLGKGTIYRYFASKQELFLATVDRGMRRLSETVLASAVGVDDPLDVVIHAVRAYLRFFKQHPEYVELLIQERAEFRDRKTPTYFVHREVNRVRWRQHYADLMASGRLRTMPVERILDVIGGLLYGTMFTNHFAGRDKCVADQAEDILDVIFHGILTPEERRRLGRCPEQDTP